jgi:hypothetical protein
MSASLNPRQKRFVEEFLVDLNGTQAAIRAGYSESAARRQATRMLDDQVICNAIKAAMDARSARTLVNADTVLRQWLAMATADPNELVEFRRTCCRCCWGKGFAYQLTAGELAARQRENPDEPITAELGYDGTRDPHPKCPECHGEGVGTPFFKDTRYLSPGARALYAGVKVTKDGIEVKMNSQDKAWEMVAKHLGMNTEKHKHEHTGADGKPLPAAPPPVMIYLPSNGRDPNQGN